MFQIKVRALARTAAVLATVEEWPPGPAAARDDAESRYHQPRSDQVLAESSA